MRNIPIFDYTIYKDSVNKKIPLLVSDGDGYVLCLMLKRIVSKVAATLLPSSAEKFFQNRGDDIVPQFFEIRILT